MPRLFCFLLVSLFLVSNSSAYYHRAVKKGKQVSWYKRYSGTIAGQKVLVHLSRQGDVIWELWEPSDIFTADSATLSALLTKEAEKIYGLTLSVKSVPYNSNFYFDNAGITFSYDPYEIASFAEGQILVFIPYSELKDMLKPSFIKRMNFIFTK